MKQIILTTLVAGAVLAAGCSKENGSVTAPGKEKSTVILSVEHEKAPPVGRAEAGKVNDHTLTLAEGYIFFVESNGVIVRYLEMKTTADPTDRNEFALGDITGGKAVIEDVLTSAEKCYIFANIPAATKTAIQGMNLTEGASNIAPILALEMGLNDLVDSSFGVSAMPQFGVGNVVQPATPGDDMTATVDVYAMGSRLQIAKLTGTGDIKDFKLDGIFVNNYFAGMPVSAVLDIDDIVNNGSDVNRYDGTYAPYLPLEISDYAQGALAVVTPGATEVVGIPDNSAEVWAYNIWPTGGVPAADRAEAMPHLVIVFSDVEYEVTAGVTETAAGPLFLTVKGMKKTGETQSLQEILKGNSYTFTNISFEFSDLTTVPEVDTIDAEVTINMIGWKDNEVVAEV